MPDDTRPPLAAAHDPSPRKPRIAVPPRACDCHAHVFGPGDTYPFIPHGLYTPADALGHEYRHMLDALGVERGVLVQPSIYGTDNQAMLDTMAKDPERLRGIAVLPFNVADTEIERLNGLGVRGIRCNIVDLKFNKGVLALDELRGLAERIRDYGWHVEFLMHVNEFPSLEEQLRDFPVDVVFGHLGYVPTGEGLETAGFRGLLRLMEAGKAWVKLTAPYRLTLSAMPYPDTAAFARKLVETAPERLLWGSDWPHTYIKTAMPNDGDLMDLFGEWVANEATRRRILVDNPERLYGF